MMMFTMIKNNSKPFYMRYIREPKKKQKVFRNLSKFLLIDFIFIVRVKMDTSGSQQNSTGGNVIVLNSNDLMQQRTSLGNGQQVLNNKFYSLFFFCNLSSYIFEQS
jgi:hypothetical protein